MGLFGVAAGCHAGTPPVAPRPGPSAAPEAPAPVAACEPRAAALARKAKELARRGVLDVRAAVLGRAYDACPDAARALAWARAAREVGAVEQAKIAYELAQTDLHAPDAASAEATRGLAWARNRRETFQDRVRRAGDFERAAADARRHGQLVEARADLARAREAYWTLAPSLPPEGTILELAFGERGLTIARTGGVERIDSTGTPISRKASCRSLRFRDRAWPPLGTLCDASFTGEAIPRANPYGGSTPTELADAFALTPDRSWLVASLPSGAAFVARLTDPGIGQRSFLEAGSPMKAVAISPDGRMIAGAVSGRVLLWKIAKGHADEKHSAPHLKPFRRIALPKSAGTVVDVALTAHGLLGVLASNGELYLWRGGWRRIVPPRPARSLAFSSSGKQVAVVDAAGNVSRWRMSARGPVALPELGSRSAADAEPSPPRADVDAVAFSRDDRRIAAGSTDGSVRVWESDKLLVEVPGYAHARNLAVDGGALVVDSFTREWRGPVGALGKLASAGPPTMTGSRTRAEIHGTSLFVDDGHIVARDASGQELYRLYFLTDGSTFAQQGSAFQLGGSAEHWIRVLTPAGLRPFELAEDRWLTDLLGGESAAPYRTVAELHREYRDVAMRPHHCAGATCSKVTLALRGWQLAPCCPATGGCGVALPGGMGLGVGCVPLAAPGRLDPGCPELGRVAGLPLRFPGCRRPDGSCGYFVNVFGVDLGCTDVASRARARARVSATPAPTSTPTARTPRAPPRLRLPRLHPPRTR